MMCGLVTIGARSTPKAIKLSLQTIQSFGNGHGPIWVYTTMSPISRPRRSTREPRKCSILAGHRAQCRCSMPFHTLKNLSLLTICTSLSHWHPALSAPRMVPKAGGRTTSTSSHRSVSTTSTDHTGIETTRRSATISARRPAITPHVTGASLCQSNLRYTGGRIPIRTGSRSMHPPTMSAKHHSHSLTSPALTRSPSQCL